MELVINISEDAYKVACNGCMLPPDVENVVKSIKNGKILPKGHGILVDTEELKQAFITWSMAVQGIFTDADIASIVCNANPVVEADKEEKEND